MNIDVKQVKKLREETGAGVMDAKKALKESDGDLEGAKEWLKEQGSKIAEKKSSREADDGAIESYIHNNGKIGVLVEVRSETDFVAKNDEFQELIKELALQVAGMRPAYVDKQDVPEEVIEEKKREWKKEIDEDKPEEVMENILEGKLNGYYEEVCLMQQPYFRDQEIQIEEKVNDVLRQVKENIEVSRFVRMELGGEVITAESNS